VLEGQNTQKAVLIVVDPLGWFAAAGRLGMEEVRPRGACNIIQNSDLKP
jgi:hypothetical protein